MRALDEQMGEIATAISVMVLAAIEPRLAALENNGEVVIPDPGWDRGPQQTVAIDPRLLAKQAGLRRRRAAAAQRRIWGGIEGRVRQCHEVVALDNELARVDRQIFLAERS
jgi:hypothetical protein